MVSIQPGESTWSSRARRLAQVVLYVGPIVLWLAVIALASTDIASQAHSDHWVWRLLRLFVSDASEDVVLTDGFGALSWVLRKAAHLVEYGVFGILATIAVRGLFPRLEEGADRQGLVRTAALVLSVGFVVGAGDEMFQSLVPSRTPSAWDTLIDVLGVGLGFAIYWFVARRQHLKRRRRGAT